MTSQEFLFELGDALGDELARTSADGATWTEPSLFQQGREATAAELVSDADALERSAEHRAAVEEHASATDPAQVRAMFRGLGWSVTE